MTKVTKKEIDKLRDVLEKNRLVKVVYLFGSAATGRTGPLSDIDIGVYLNEKLSSSKTLDIQLELINEMCSIFKTDKVDVVIMNNSPILLNYNIIRGKQIFSRKEDDTIHLEHSIMSEYLDRKYYIDRRAKYLIETISKSGLL